MTALSKGKPALVQYALSEGRVSYSGRKGATADDKNNAARPVQDGKAMWQYMAVGSLAHSTATASCVGKLKLQLYNKGRVICKRYDARRGEVRRRHAQLRQAVASA